MIKNILLIILFFSFTIFPQSFTASVNETTIADNERFQVSFTFSGSSINNLSNFKPPAFKDFLILSGPNQSSSIQIINGVHTASVSYSFIVQPKSIGTFVIEKASIVQNGKTFESKAITIKVEKGSTKPQSQNNNSSIISDEEIAENLFIRATVDKSSAYKGEQVTVTYKLYTRLNIAAQMSINKLPQYQGFWAEELDTQTNITFKTEVINGKQFRVGLLKRVALFPTQTGKLEVTPFELTVPVQIQKQRSNNLFDDFFGDPFGRNQTIEFNVKSNIVKVDIRPLPENGKPESFHGAVGKFQFETSLNKNTTKANEPLTLNVNVSGTGNIKLLEMPEAKLPNGFEKYDPKISEDINRKGKISGSKKGEYLFVPRVVGVRDIPALEFSYFDPEEKKYITVNSKSFTINIEQGDAQQSPLVVGKENVEQLGDDIRFIKTNFDDVTKKEEYVLFTPSFWAASILPLLALSLLIGWKKRSDKLAGNVTLLRYQKAQKIARSRLKTASKLMKENNYKELYTEISLALFGYLEDKLHIPKAEFTLDRAGDELSKRGITRGLISDLKKSAEKCEFVRFAPGAEKNAAMQDMYDEIADVIINIEKSLAEQKSV